MNPDRALMQAYDRGVQSERNRREAQRAQSRAAQPKRKHTRKRRW